MAEYMEWEHPLSSEVTSVEASDYLCLTILIILHLNSSWPHHTKTDKVTQMASRPCSDNRNGR